MWWKRKQEAELIGSVSFRGSLPPRAEDFGYLEARGFEIEPLVATPETHWQLGLRHEELGQLSLVCLRDAPPVPDVLIEHDARLNEEDKRLARLPHRTVSVRLGVPGENVLAERKLLLGALHEVMGADGLLAIDHLSQAFWSREALDLELLHGADVDILSLFTAHSLVGDSGAPYWLHTHGLAELGFVDFDVVAVAEDFSNGWEAMRALAFAVVEGKLSAGGASCAIVGGAPEASLVAAAEFAQLVGNDYPEWLDSLDSEHTDGHAVVCDAAKRGWFSFFARKPQPWSVLRRGLSDDAPLLFSDAASTLMSERARGTWPILPALHEELTPLGCMTLAKLRFEGASGGEHLWFEVHALSEQGLDATLLNDPWQDLGISKGERRKHSLERLSDWSIITPAGTLSPRQLTALRPLREHRGEIEKMLAERSGG